MRPPTPTQALASAVLAVLAILAGGNLHATSRSRLPPLPSSRSSARDAVAPVAAPAHHYPDGFAPPLEFVNITKRGGSAIEAAPPRANRSSARDAVAPVAAPAHHYPDGFAPPLEFVHITKTGGSAIEAAAARANRSSEIAAVAPAAAPAHHYPDGFAPPLEFVNITKTGGSAIEAAPPRANRLSTRDAVAPVAAPAHHYPDGFAPPLEFVHITKTGGSAIEAAAARANVRWGTCHWKSVPKWGSGCKKRKEEEKKKIMRPIRENVPEAFRGVNGEPWHLPPHWFREHPFRGGRRQGPDLFLVVRDPYERMMSEYHCPFGGFKGRGRSDPRMLNRWIRIKLRVAPSRAHRLPQHLYVWNEGGERVVEHFLRHEALDAEFARLMGQYNLTGVRLPAKKMNARDFNRSALTVDDLTNKTIAAINHFYREDFRQFNYTMRMVAS